MKFSFTKEELDSAYERVSKLPKEDIDAINTVLCHCLRTGNLMLALYDLNSAIRRYDFEQMMEKEYPSGEFHDPESDFIDAVEKAVIQVDKEDEQMNDNKEYTIEVSVDDKHFEAVSRHWIEIVMMLKEGVKLRAHMYPNCTPQFVLLLNEVRAFFGETINEDEWDIGAVWDNEESINLWDYISVDEDNPIGVIIYVQDMTKLDKSYREMTFLINKED